MATTVLKMHRVLIFIAMCSSVAYSQGLRVLTLEQCLEIALSQSVDVARLDQSLINSRMNLRAAQSGLKSNSEIRLTNFPNFLDVERQVALPDGSTTFARTKSLEFQGELSVNQPIRFSDGVFSLVATFDRFEDFETGTSLGSESKTTFSPNLSLRFRQPLFTLNQLNTRFRRASLNLEKTVQSYTLEQLNIVHSVTISFYNLFKSQQQLQIDSTRVKQSENAYRIANLKQQAGLLAEVDVLRLEVDLANARNTAAGSLAGLRETADAFNVQIGLPLEDEIEVTTNLTYDPIDVTLEKALRESLSRRTELRTDEIDIELSEINIKETDSQREIKGELNLRYGITNRQEDFRDSFQDFNKDRSVTLSLTVPLWDWSQNKYQVEAAKASLESTRLTQNNRTNIIRQEVRTAVRNLQSAQQRVEITGRSQVLADKSYKISLLKFENGDLNTQDLALEQNRLSDAQVNSLNAIIDYKNALSDLRRKTLWDFETNQPVRTQVPEE